MSQPVPGAGRSRWHRRRSRGVSANSRMVRHRYADEGDKGQWFRRFIRRREERMWRSEIED